MLSDCHIPFHDRHVVDRWLQHANTLKPDAIDIIGDTIDAYPLSRFDKNPERRATLQDELDQCSVLLDGIRAAVHKGTEIHYTEGNHEQRLRRLLWGKCSEFAGIRNLTMPELLQLPKRGVVWHSIDEPYQLPGSTTWVTHGDIVRKHSGATARAKSDRIESSVICGHSHRMGWCPTTSWTGCRDAWEVGHVCDPRKLEYVSGPPQWQQGWAVVYVGNGWTDVSFVRVVRKPGRHGTDFVFQGKSL